jgi:hypothetical protein
MNKESLLGKDVEHGLAMSHWLNNLLEAGCDFSDYLLTVFNVELYLSFDVVYNILSHLGVFVEITCLVLENFNSLVGAPEKCGVTHVLHEDVSEHQLNSEVPHTGALAELLG